MTKLETKHQPSGKQGKQTGLIVGIVVVLLFTNGARNAFYDNEVLWGIGFIIAAVLGFFYSIGLGQSFITGACPYCGHTIHTFKTNLNKKCKACRKRIVIKEDRFIGIE